MEIRSQGGAMLARATFPAAEIRRNVAVRMEFAEIDVCDEPCLLGVFADEVDVPVYLLEWRRYPYWGLVRMQTRAFCTMLFSEGE
jgi:hypothetical protein